jgi:uroporphyrinogen decarboxylase
VKSNERVFKVLRRQNPDRIPTFELIIDEKIIQKMNPGFTYFDFLDYWEIDGAGINAAYDYETGVLWIDRDKRIFRDKWGIVRQFSAESVAYPISGPISEKKDLLKYTAPNPENDSLLLEKLGQVVKRYKGKKAIIWIIHDCFNMPSALRGETQFLMDIVTDPKFAKELIDICVEYEVEAVKNAIKEGAEVIVLGDDYAHRSGPFMSPDVFCDLFLPGIDRIVKTVKEQDAYCVKHCCGNIWKLIDMFLSTCIDGLHPLEPKAGMDIGEVKKRYGEKLCLIGNVDCSEVLSHYDVQSVIDETKRCIDLGGVDGGYILSSSNTIHSSVDPDNYRAMLRTVMDYGTYSV